MTIAFSGNRGYHIGIDNRVFGDVRPSKHLNMVFARIRKEIPKVAGLSEDDRNLVDYSISDKTRLWRFVNTRHAKSNLYKVQISGKELFGLSADKIRNIAGSPRSLLLTDETGLAPRFDVGVCSDAMELYRKSAKSAKGQERRFTRRKISYEIDDLKPLKEILCDARYNLLNSNVPKGQRNRSALILVSAFRSGGYSEERARDAILKWNDSQEISLPNREIGAVVKSVYRAPGGYRFGCRSLGEYCPYKDRRECADYRRFRVLTG